MKSFFVCLLALATLTDSYAKAPCIVAVSLDPPQDNNTRIIEPTLKRLTEVLGEKNLKVVRLPLGDLEKRIVEGKIDIFLSTSGLSRRMIQKGASQLATMLSDRFPNPNKAYGTLFITSSDSQINSLKDMKGKSLVTNLKGGFYGHQIGLGELAKQGFDPYTFFSSTFYVGRDLKNVVNAVIEKKAEIGSISSCFLEDTYQPNDPIWRLIKPIAVKKNNSPCLSSTDLYPNWSISSMPTTSADIAKKVTTALLTMPKTKDGLSWGIGTDSTKTDELFKELQLGPFDFLKDWFSKEFRSRYAIWVFLVVTLLIFSLVTSFVLGKIVKRRTASLTSSLEAQRTLQKKARIALDRVNILEKYGIVDQLSTIVAHELRQPFTTIKAFLYGAQRKAEKGNLSNQEMVEILCKIRKQSDRAETIVNHVRNYAKQRERTNTIFDFGAAVNKACQNFKDCGNFSGQIFASIERELFVRGDQLEIEIVVSNLLRNSLDSLTSTQTRKPKINLKVFSENQMAKLIVADNGGYTPTPSGNPFTMKEFNSEKKNGLGLGLVIVKAIAARYGGRFSLDIKENKATASFYIPLEEKDDN